MENKWVHDEKARSTRDLVLQKMIRISWKDRITNGEVYHRMNTHILIDRDVHMQLSFFGHVIGKDYLEGLVVTGFLDGKLARGRPSEIIPHIPQQDDEQVALRDEIDGEQ